MLKFILQIVMMVSLASILYLVSRALPRINDSDLAAHEKSVRLNWLMVQLEKIDFWIKNIFEKFLRRLRVWLLKLDNSVTKKLGSFRRDSAKEAGFPEEPVEEIKKES